MNLRLLFISLLFVLLNSCAPLQVISFDAPYIKVFEGLPGDKNELFLKANDWMVKTFNNAASVIQYSDKEAGTLIGKYLMFGEVRSGMYGVTVDTQVFAKINIEIKDNKARLSIEPLGSWKYDPSGMTIYKLSRENANAKIIELSESFSNALTKKVVNF